MSDIDRPAGTRLIAGRYRLGPVIGRGGMATIHRATDLRLERDVAVKLLRPEVTRDQDLAQRFRREALAATVLRHPNIVACLDTGTDGDQPFLVMDLVDGEDLAARLRRSGRLAPWQAARICLDVARGLSVAHARGIVHRDVKPGNILLAVDGRAMVTDFGIARLAADAEAALPGTTLGSVHYFSPEQARGLTTTPASDVYGLGLVLYEALTGKRAWSGDTTDAIALARVGATPPTPRSSVPEVPAALEAVVMRALAPEPGDRYAHGGAMATALEAIITAGERVAPTARAETAAPAALAPSPVPPAVPPAAVSPEAHATDRPPVEAAVPPLVPAGAPGRQPPMVGANVAGASAAGGGAARSTGRSRRPRWSGVALTTLALAGGLLGVMLVAALPGAAGLPSRADGSSDGLAATTQRPTAAPTSVPSARPSAVPTPTAMPTPEPTEAPGTPPPGKVADLCETFFGLPCGLGPGRYAPSRFDPAFDIKLGDGWSTAQHATDLVTLVRDEGLMTFAARVAEVYPGGVPTAPRDRARDIIESFVVTEGVTSTKPARVRIDGRKGYSVDLATVDRDPVPLFRTADETFYLESGRTTRLVALDVRGTTVLLAIEPAGDHDLRSVLDTADVAAGTIRWR